MPVGCSWCFCIHSSGLDVARCQIVNTPSKAAKYFYSRIERLNVFIQKAGGRGQEAEDWRQEEIIMNENFSSRYKIQFKNMNCIEAA